MIIDTKGLSQLVQEASALSNKPNWTKQDERRNVFLLSAIAAVKAGATLESVYEQDDQERRKRVGLPLKKSFLTTEQREIARGWQKVVQYAHLGKHGIEQRDMAEGNPISRIGTYNDLGYFVPTGFYDQLFSAMAAHDVLFDGDSGVTLIKSTNGEPLPVPVAGDIENVASVVGEATQTTSVDISVPGHATLGAWKYTTWDAISRESFQDLEGTLTALNIFRAKFADRFARGIGKDLVTGSSSSKPLGLVPALLAAGVPTVAASGSGANDGSSNTGANSLGSADFESALADLDDAYASSPTCAWLMNKKTLARVSGQLDKYGNILNLVRYVGGQPTIFDIPVKICPSMDNIGNGNNPVVLGDLSYWATRLIVDGQSGIQVINEASGLVEYGKVALRAFMRADGALLYNDTSSPAPFVVIQTHS